MGWACSASRRFRLLLVDDGLSSRHACGSCGILLLSEYVFLKYGTLEVDLSEMNFELCDAHRVTCKHCSINHSRVIALSNDFIFLSIAAKTRVYVESSFFFLASGLKHRLCSIVSYSTI